MKANSGLLDRWSSCTVESQKESNTRIMSKAAILKGGLFNRFDLVALKEGNISQNLE